VAADVSPLILFRQEEFEPAHAGCYDEIDGRPANPGARIFKRTMDDSPSPWGEGWIEGGHG
jgi:hypothetical protein